MASVRHGPAAVAPASRSRWYRAASGNALPL